jgi:hypothetical protein
MSSAFTNFLSNNGNGVNFKSYAHATGLYVDGNFARAPKLGFLYFIAFNITPGVVIDQQWLNSDGIYDAGMLVKKIDMPKFKITTETINQYNRKANIQTKLNYDPVSIEFHDDNSEITNGLWKNYYKYYYTDSNYGDTTGGINAFNDNKYDLDGKSYGLNNFQDKPFFDSIDIYVLHQGRFTQMRLINPMISSWEHDTVDQSIGNKVLQNKMSVVYENVFYYQGNIVEGTAPGRFASKYYDKEPSPLQVGSNPEPLNAPEQVFGPKWTPAPKPIPSYPSPTTPFSNSQLNKAAVQRGPAPAMPRPIGSASVGLTSGQRPGGFRIAGINLWYGHGGLHGRSVIQAGPIRLVLKK